MSGDALNIVGLSDILNTLNGVLGGIGSTENGGSFAGEGGGSAK